MKLRSALIIASLALGCSHSKPVTHPPVAVQPLPLPSGTSVAVNDPLHRWTAIVTSTWLVDCPKSDDPEVECQLRARSPELVGRGPVVIGVSATQLESLVAMGMPFEMYGELVAKALQSGEHGKYQGGKRILLDGRQGTINAIVLPTGMIEAVLAVADGATGYTVACGGDVEELERVRDACVPFMRSFHFVTPASKP